LIINTTTRSFHALFEEKKVQQCLKLLQENPKMTIAEAARQTRASYDRVYRRRKGIPASNSRGGHNRKLNQPQTQVLIDHLLICHYNGRSAGIFEVIESANTLLRFSGVCTVRGDDATVSRRWAERWMKQEKDFVKTIRSKPISWVRRYAMNKDDIKGNFTDFKRCKEKWGILDDDVYNFDETGCQIGITAGGRVIIPETERHDFVNDPDNRELVTSVECFSSTGYHVPPMLIFKGAYHLRKYSKNDINGNTLFAFRNGLHE
jgi:hypothetical protein